MGNFMKLKRVVVFCSRERLGCQGEGEGVVLIWMFFYLRTRQEHMEREGGPSFSHGTPPLLGFLRG